MVICISIWWYALQCAHHQQFNMVFIILNALYWIFFSNDVFNGWMYHMFTWSEAMIIRKRILLIITFWYVLTNFYSMLRAWHMNKIFSWLLIWHKFQLGLESFKQFFNDSLEWLFNRWSRNYLSALLATLEANVCVKQIFQKELNGQIKIEKTIY